jgi:hypothetical protein
MLVALFAIEQLVNGWRNGFAGDDTAYSDEPAAEELDLGL